ncbi:MAG: hypothetical protein ACR2IE_19120 [Candidatus Sumerlaeaceae bacterium]
MKRSGRKLADGIAERSVPYKSSQTPSRARTSNSRTSGTPIRPTARGKYAHVRGTSEDFARQKQREIAAEDSRLN